MQVKDIDGIMINLKRNRDVLLFLLLSASGGLNRMGNGTDTSRRDMLIRMIDPDVFAQLKPFITNDALQQTDQQFCVPNLHDAHQLDITFRSPAGDKTLQFLYDAQSPGLPEAITTLVAKAIELTDHIYTPTGVSIPQRSLAEMIPEAFPMIERTFDCLYDTVRSLQIRLSQARTAQEYEQILADCEALDTFFIRFRNTDGVLGAVKSLAEQRLQKQGSDHR